MKLRDKLSNNFVQNFWFVDNVKEENTNCVPFPKGASINYVDGMFDPIPHLLTSLLNELMKHD